MATNPVTRQEQLMNAVAEGNGTNIVPVTREEMFLAKAAGQDVETPEPITRKEMLLNKIAETCGGGGGGGDLAKQIVDRTIAAFRDDTVKSVGDYAFYQCQALKSVDLTNAEEIKMYAFVNTGLVNVVFPNVNTIGNYGFQMCRALESVDLHSATSIGNSAFAFCTALKALILRNTEQVCALGTSVFMGASIATGGGFIYVPAALIDSYKAAANWTTHAAQFRAIEDYPEICG